MAVIDVLVDGGALTAFGGDVLNIAPSSLGNITRHGVNTGLINGNSWTASVPVGKEGVFCRAATDAAGWSNTRPNTTAHCTILRGML